jgi:hypothetical protein
MNLILSTTHNCLPGRKFIVNNIEQRLSDTMRFKITFLSRYLKQLISLSSIQLGLALLASLWPASVALRKIGRVFHPSAAESANC